MKRATPSRLDKPGIAIPLATGSLAELSDQESAIEALRPMEEARAWLAAIVDSSDDAIIGKDLNGTITAWNRGAEKIFGYSASEVMGKPMLMLFPPDRVDEESDILARIRRGESVEHFETVRVRKDGRKIDISATISPIKDSSGAIVGASKIARDITERKQAEDRLAGQAEELSRQAAELLRSQEALEGQTLMLQSVLDSIGEGLVAADATGKFILWNPAATKIIGLGLEDVMPQVATTTTEIPSAPLPESTSLFAGYITREKLAQQLGVSVRTLDRMHYGHCSTRRLVFASGFARPKIYLHASEFSRLKPHFYRGHHSGFAWERGGG